jgi:hypothetical protein
VRSYLFPFCCIFIYAVIIGLDYLLEWPVAGKDDLFSLIYVFTLFFTLNYSLITRYLPYNIYKNYRNLIIAPVIPRQCFLKELLNYLKSLENVIFFIGSLFFFLYFIGKEMIIIGAISVILYYVLFLYGLIVLRFVCGHSPKGKNNFYMACLIINSLVMYQIFLVNNKLSNDVAIFFVEYNPLNTIFFLSITKSINAVLNILIVFVLWFFLDFFSRRLTWISCLGSVEI